MQLSPVMGGKASRQRRPPMISFKEAAELCGVSLNQLRADFRYSTVPIPKRNTQITTNTDYHASWYIVKDLKAWRVAFLAARTAPAPNGVSV